MELLKLMMADINETGEASYSEYQVYPMESLDLVLEDTPATTIINKVDSNFSIEEKWFINSDKLRSLNDEEYEEFLEDHADKIREIYSELEDFDYAMYNEVLVRAEILKEHLTKDSEVEEEKTLVSDMSLETIAEYLVEVKTSDIVNQLKDSWPWKIILCNEMYYLIEED